MTSSQESSSESELHDGSSDEEGDCPFFAIPSTATRTRKSGCLSSGAGGHIRSNETQTANTSSPCMSVDDNETTGHTGEVENPYLVLASQERSFLMGDGNCEEDDEDELMYAPIVDMSQDAGGEDATAQALKEQYDRRVTIPIGVIRVAVLSVLFQKYMSPRFHSSVLPCQSTPLPPPHTHTKHTKHTKSTH